MGRDGPAGAITNTFQKIYIHLAIPTMQSLYPVLKFSL
jgi:hypothetical protein